MRRVCRSLTVARMYNSTGSSEGRSKLLSPNGYRSMSMNHVTTSPYSIRNYPSNPSLTSNHERALLQRPRSPFAYPARLKRPGFRPSSPALTDDGSVDYSRRAEIDRASEVCIFQKSCIWSVLIVSVLHLDELRQFLPHLHGLDLHLCQ